MPRPRCARCELPLRSCLCACVRTVAHRTAVRVLQHPSEAAHAKNSLRLLRLCLQDCEVLQAEALPAVEAARLVDAALLYPGGAPLLTAPRTLWVVDGSWRQSRALLRASPALAALPRVSLDGFAAPLYAELRKAEGPGQASTLEAVARALTQLEQDPRIECELTLAFQAWLAQRAAWAQSSLRRLSTSTGSSLGA